MPEVIRSPEAQADAIEIWTYIAKDNPAAANRLIDRIDAKLRLLAEAPLIGTARPELAPSLRSLAIDNYLLFFRPIADGIEVVRILHGARDLRRIFRRKPFRRLKE